MIQELLVNHLKLCRKNLKSNRVKCCTECPFEDEIVEVAPTMAKLFEAKRHMIANKGM